MLQRTLQALTLACGVAVAVLATATESRAGCRLIDCLFGTAPAAPSATTYAPPYVPAPAYAAPRVSAVRDGRAVLHAMRHALRSIVRVHACGRAGGRLPAVLCVFAGSDHRATSPWSKATR